MKPRAVAIWQRALWSVVLWHGFPVEIWLHHECRWPLPSLCDWGGDGVTIWEQHWEIQFFPPSFFNLFFHFHVFFILILRTEIIMHLPCNNVVICHINTLPLYGNYGFIKWSTATMLAKNNYTFVPCILKCSQLLFFFLLKRGKKCSLVNKTTIWPNVCVYSVWLGMPQSPILTLFHSIPRSHLKELHHSYYGCTFSKFPE